MQVARQVPFADLITPQLELEEELLAVFRASLRNGNFMGGPMVDDFEREFARYCGARFCIGVGSGKEALRLALLAVGVNPGDIVLTVPNAFAADAEAICQAGARPDFVDVDEKTCSMDWSALEEHLETECYREAKSGTLIDRETERRLTAIVPVHLYGQTADMDRILDIAERYGVAVIEDARQAHGAEYFSAKENRWRRAGSLGHAAIFSFDPGASLSACGEAAAITTNDGMLQQKIRALRDHGQTREEEDDSEHGVALDAIQAGVLEVKLRHLPAWNRARRENAFCYHGLLTGVSGSVIIPYEPSWAKAMYHSYVIRVGNRDALRSHLSAANIVTKIQGPVPLHWQGYPSARAFPTAEKLARETLSLPTYPQLGFDQQYRIAHKIAEFVARERATKSYSAPASPRGLDGGALPSERAQRQKNEDAG